MKKTIEAQIGELVNKWIQDFRRDSITYNEIEWFDNQFTIHADDFCLTVEFEYEEELVEKEQEGDWFTPHYPAVYSYNITEIKASYIKEDGIERPVPMFKNLEMLSHTVLNTLIHE